MRLARRFVQHFDAENVSSAYLRLRTYVHTCYTLLREVRTQKGGLPSIETEGIFALHRKEGGAMVTYSDLIQIGIFLVSLVSLIYEIYKDRK